MINTDEIAEQYDLSQSKIIAQIGDGHITNARCNTNSKNVVIIFSNNNPMRDQNHFEKMGRITQCVLCQSQEMNAKMLFQKNAYYIFETESTFTKEETFKDENLLKRFLRIERSQEDLKDLAIFLLQWKSQKEISPKNYAEGEKVKIKEYLKDYQGLIERNLFNFIEKALTKEICYKDLRTEPFTENIMNLFQKDYEDSKSICSMKKLIYYNIKKDWEKFIVLHLCCSLTKKINIHIKKNEQNSGKAYSNYLKQMMKNSLHKSLELEEDRDFFLPIEKEINLTLYMTLRILNENKGFETIKIPQDARVLDLKTQISPIPEDEFILLANGYSKMKNEKYLEDYDLKDGSLIIMINCDPSLCQMFGVILFPLFQIIKIDIDELDDFEKIKLKFQEKMKDIEIEFIKENLRIRPFKIVPIKVSQSIPIAFQLPNSKFKVYTLPEVEKKQLEEFASYLGFDKKIQYLSLEDTKEIENKMVMNYDTVIHFKDISIIICLYPSIGQHKEMKVFLTDSTNVIREKYE